MHRGRKGAAVLSPNGLSDMYSPVVNTVSSFAELQGDLPAAKLAGDVVQATA